MNEEITQFNATHDEMGEDYALFQALHSKHAEMRKQFKEKRTETLQKFRELEELPPNDKGLR